MNRREFITALGVLGAVSAVRVSTLKAQDMPLPDQGRRSLILMGWDGADYSVVSSMMAEGKLPNLARVGTLRHLRIVGTGNTCTMPTWTQVFTGLAVDQSGCTGNKQYARVKDTLTVYDETYKRFEGFWTRQIPHGQGIPRLLNKVGIPAYVHASKMFISDNPERTCLAEVVSASDLHSVWHPPVLGDDYLPQMVDTTLELISQQASPYFLFFHVNPDFYGHRFGGRSDRYKQEIERSDKALGQIMSAIGPDTRFIVMSDHGFDPVDVPDGYKVGQHRNAPNAFISTNLPLAEPIGIPLDIFPTVLDYFGQLQDRMTNSYKPLLRGISRLEV